MFNAELKVAELHLIEGYTYVFQHAPEVLQILVNRVFTRHTQDIYADLHKEAPPVKYPIQWKSERQRRAFFATKGFGRGIPTKRSGAMLAAWKLVLRYQYGQMTEIIAESDSPYRQFVTGPYQQPFHTNTGWWKEADTFTIWGMILTEEVETEIIKSFYAIDEVT